MKIKYATVLFTLFSIACISPLLALEGESIYKANCAACHSIGKGKLVGPDLKGVKERFEEAWLVKWIKSSQSLIKAGDEKALKLFNENSNLIMPDQPLNDEEIKSLLSFIEEKAKILTVEKKSAVDNSTITFNAGISRKSSDSLLSVLGFSGYIQMLIILLLLIIVWVLSMTVREMAKRTLENDNSDDSSLG